MKEFFRYVFASMLGFILGNIVLSIIMFFVIMIMVAVFSSNAMKKLSDKESNITENSILKLDFRQPVVEYVDENPFMDIDFIRNEMNLPMSLKSVIDNIGKAKDDPKISGIYLNLSIVPISYATLIEIRKALVDFKKSKKFIYSYSDIYTEQAYYLASVSDSIFMEPSGLFVFNGFSTEMSFLRGTFDKLEMEPKIIRAGKYKSAGESFTEYKMSKENREQVSALINSIYDNYLVTVADGRKMDTATLRSIAAGYKIRKAADAVSNKLVDKLCFYDQFDNRLKKLTGKKDKEYSSNLVSLADYSRSKVEKKEKTKSENKIALIYAVGTIGMGGSSSDNMDATAVCEALVKARTTDKVKAIVLRINSPGGSALVSDIIWREVWLARQVKPVVVSMGNVAASGGYYIASPANYIFAEPNTITGSIGVFGMYLNTEKFFKNKLGISFDRYKTDPYADLGNPNRTMGKDEEAVVQYMIMDIYSTFKNNVANGRKISPDSVEMIAQGRVWSGEQALKIHLVDELGGLYDAIEKAKKLAKINDYKLVMLPKAKNPFEQFFRRFSMSKVKSYVLKQALEDDYDLYMNVKMAKEMNGVYMMMPFVPVIE